MNEKKFEIVESTIDMLLKECRILNLALVVGVCDNSNPLMSIIATHGDKSAQLKIQMELKHDYDRKFL